MGIIQWWQFRRFMITGARECSKVAVAKGSHVHTVIRSELRELRRDGLRSL